MAIAEVTAKKHSFDLIPNVAIDIFPSGKVQEVSKNLL
jgi:hypothetical protein